MDELSRVDDVSSLKVALLPGRAPLLGALELYNESYKTWRHVWTETFKEVDGSGELHSDHFTRQDYVLSLFHDSRAAGLVCFRRTDLSIEAHREDSWFKPWPQEMLYQMGRETPKGLVVSWVTIHPDYRRSQSDERLRNLNISQRLSEMMSFFLSSSGTSLGFGVTRNNRSVNKFCAYAGSSTLSTEAQHHGEAADLIVFYPDQVAKAQKEYSLGSHRLWKNRFVYTDEGMDMPQPKVMKAAA